MLHYINYINSRQQRRIAIENNVQTDCSALQMSVYTCADALYDNANWYQHDNTTEVTPNSTEVTPFFSMNYKKVTTAKSGFKINMNRK